MNPVQHIIRSARRRHLLDVALRRCARGLAVGLAAGLALLAVDRLAAVHVPWIAYALLAGAGVLGGAIAALLSRPTPLQIAVRLDRALKLRDRIATAQLLEQARGRAAAWADEDFAELARLDAQRLAGTIDARAAAPLTYSAMWSACAALALLLAAGVLYLPRLSRASLPGGPGAGGAASPQDIAQLQQQSAEAAQAIRQAMAGLPRDAPARQPLRDELDALDRLAQQLAEGGKSPREANEARQQSAARMSAVAEQLARQADDDQAAAGELAQRFSGLDSVNAPDAPLTTEQFNRALERGDFGTASGEIQKLLQKRGELSESQRAAAAEHLRSVARELDEHASDPAPALQERREQLEQALRDLRFDDQAVERMMDQPPDPQRLARELESERLDREVAERLARDLEQLHQREQAQKQAQRDQRDVADSLRRSAEQLQKPGDQPPPPASENQPGAPSPQHGDRTQQPRQDQSRQSNDAKPADRGTDDRANPSSRDAASSGPGDRSASRSQQQREQSQPQQPGDQPSSSPGAADSPAQQQQQRQEQPGGEAASSAQRPEQQRGPDDAARRPGNDQAAPRQDGEAAPDEQPQTSRDGNAAGEALRRLAERANSAGQRRRSAQEIRELAQRLADNMTPEQLEQLARRWGQRQQQQQQEQEQQQEQQAGASPADQDAVDAARELADGLRDGQSPQPGADALSQGDSAARGRPSSSSRRGSPGQDGDALRDSPPPLSITGADDIDLRDPDTAEKLLARWLSDEPAGAAPAGEGARERGAAIVRQAQQVAERAVNESAVPRRYHKMIQRYFGRLPRTLERAAPTADASAPAPAPRDQ